MAKAKLAEVTENTYKVPPDPVPEKFCETCVGWTSNNGIYGQCLPSGRFLSAPIVTTNFTTCKNWAKRA